MGGNPGLSGCMFVTEQHQEQDGHHQGIGSKGNPDPIPVETFIRVRKIFGDHQPADPATQPGPKSIRHHHEDALRTGPDVGFYLGVHKDGPGDIEEIKRHPVHDTGQDDHP